MFKAFEPGRPIFFYSLGMICTIMLTVVGCMLESYITPVLIKYTAALFS